MHLHKFADMARFDEIGIGGNFEETGHYRAFFKGLHPSQFLNSCVRIPIYEITCGYMTKRQNYKVAKKYMFLYREHEELDIEIDMAFQDWVEEFNQRRPYRKISNAEILEIKPIAYARIFIGLS